MRKTKISLLLLMAGVLLFILLASILLINAYKAEQRQFKFTRQYYLSTAFYEQGISAKAMGPFSSYVDSVFNQTKHLSPAQVQSINNLLHNVTSDYKWVKDNFHELLIKDNINAPFNMAILINRLHIHRRDSVYRLYDKEHSGAFFVVSGDPSKVDLTMPDNTFFYRLNDAGVFLQIAAYVKFDNPRNYLLKQLSNQLLMVVIMFALFLIIVFYASKTIRQQEALDEMKTDFINNMTHELKTPLTTLSVATKTITHETLSETTQMINKQVKRLEKTVNKVMGIALMTDRKTLDLELFFIVPFIREVIADAKLLFWNVNSEVNVDEQQTIQADPFMLSVAISNLVDNAYKYGNKKEVSIVVNLQQGMLTIQVADTGPGIPEKYQAYLFDKFYRVPTGNVHQVKGTGLGLHHVKQIIKAHRGTVKLESAPDKGTKVTLMVPVKGNNN